MSKTHAAVQDAHNAETVRADAVDDDVRTIRYDQGRMYLQALDSGLFSSQRRLAVAIGVSHTWVRKAVQIAALPKEVIEAFPDPTAIQPAHAEGIVAALAADAAAVMRRAAELGATKRCAKRSATDVVHRLIGRADAQDETFVIRCGSRTVGHWRRTARGVRS